jgi:hypothetical protein
LVHSFALIRAGDGRSEIAFQVARILRAFISPRCDQRKRLPESNASNYQSHETDAVERDCRLAREAEVACSRRGRRTASPAPQAIRGQTKPRDLQGLRHRYRDSNPGFRTENPIMEANSEWFRRISAELVRWSAVEFAGIGDQFRD